MTEAEAYPAEFAPSGPLTGRAPIPGDKSISHRALMLSALAVGRSRIEGLSEGLDLVSTAHALRAMGARIKRQSDESWTVNGVGTGGLLQPLQALEMGNSGTSTRLLMGLIASHNVEATLTGDPSLERRPMARIAEPLRRMGAEIRASVGDRLPLKIRGICPAVPHLHRLDIASAQVKSALLLAALNTPGITRIVQSVRTRDHTERMLKRFGADISVDGPEIALRGEAELRPQQLTVPADPSAAAFLIVAALIVPGSEIRIEGICLNPLRTGLFTILKEMGADLAISNEQEIGGEPAGDIVARHSSLKGVEIPPDIAPSMIDEFPSLFIAAAFAQGTTVARGLSELRVKESDRIAAMADGLRAIGAKAHEREDGISISGTGGEPLSGGGTIDPRLDHRVAMSFAVAGLHCRQPLTVLDMSPVETSFPGFTTVLKGLCSA
jgi:3-phosphoshikimate 1-carboxyvinyltransferase